ncbi:MAG: DUF2652 domain-containing protein [Flavobacteriales bacterium]|nr:DUF2652 domain-containing protein [Flavobacteriales bacterium]
MQKSLLFIPDISGYTKFIQSTEIEHAEHVIAEILEVLIAANTEELKLAEIEGDALFFYKEGSIPSQERLLAQVEGMFSAFYGHLKMMEKNRICTCNACATAPNLELKIVAHTGAIQFLKVQGNKKPFGSSVITVHRLLKNSVNSNNYVLLSKDLSNSVDMKPTYQSDLFGFKEAKEEYDDVMVDYIYSNIDVEQLQITPFEKPFKVNFKKVPDAIFDMEFNTSANELLEIITNYKYRGSWVKGVDSFVFNENEVTRLGTEHTCIVNGKQLDFVTVIKDCQPNEIIYGELTKSPPPVDELYNFFIITPINETSCRMKVEIYAVSKSPFKKLLFLFVKGVLKKSTANSLENLKTLVNSKKK